LLVAASVGLAQKKDDNTFTDPEKAGPDFLVQGEYEGTAGKDKVGAQVIADGDGKFTIFFLAGGLPGAGWDGKTRTKLPPAKTEDGKVSFADKTWSGDIGGGKLNLKNADGTAFTLSRVERKSSTLGAKPPEGAMVLFDGKNADEWKGGKVSEDGLLF